MKKYDKRPTEAEVNEMRYCFTLIKYTVMRPGGLPAEAPKMLEGARSTGVWWPEQI